MTLSARTKIPTLLFLGTVALFFLVPWGVQMLARPVVVSASEFPVELRLEAPEVRAAVLSEAAEARIETQDATLRVKIAGSISILVLIAAFYVVLSKKFPEAQNKWAFGVIGTVLGHWLG